jgi:hypothetical protein
MKNLLTRDPSTVPVSDVRKNWRPQVAVLHKGIDMQMSKERVTRRQKDVSRVLREKNRLRKSLVKKIKKK